VNAESIITVSAAVVALVQLIKWAGLRDSLGPLAVVGLSALGVGVFIFGGDHWPPARMDTWPTFAGWIAVATSAAGVFGFTRAAASAVTRTAPPPDGAAGSEPTQADATLAVLGLDFPIVHRGHQALWALVPAEDGKRLTAGQTRHMGGLPVREDEPILCDRCGEHLVGVDPVDGQWVARGETA